MDDKSHDIIIIKRHGGHEEEHHGGAWKIAFADFMTAMMAFFLVLWIINATDKNTKTIIARYFNPLKLEDLTKSNKGIRQVTGDEAKEPQKDDGELTPVQTEPPSKTPNDKKQPAPKDGAKDGPKDGVKDGAKENVKFDTQPVDPAHPKAHIAESTLLEDPYDSLDKIAGKFAPTSGDQEGGGAGATPPPGDADAFIDPFKPMERATTGGGGARPRRSRRRLRRPRARRIPNPRRPRRNNPRRRPSRPLRTPRRIRRRRPRPRTRRRPRPRRPRTSRPPHRRPPPRRRQIRRPARRARSTTPMSARPPKRPSCGPNSPRTSPRNSTARRVLAWTFRRRPKASSSVSPMRSISRCSRSARPNLRPRSSESWTRSRRA